MAESFGLNIWTKNSPKDFLQMYPAYAHAKGLPVEALVDDILPAVVFDRTDEQTAAMNRAYQDEMSRVGFDRVTFVSDVFLRDEAATGDLDRLIAIGNRIGVSAFMGLLPERKRDTYDELRMTEIIDPCWQIAVLEAGLCRTGITRYLTGRRSTALFRLAKQIVPALEFDIID